MRERPFAPCRLCRKEAPLCDSHLFAAAMYKLLRSPGTQLAPVTRHRKGSYSSSRQIKDYLLCEDCEKLLKDNGEDWMTRNCYHINGKFPLREKVQKCEIVAWSQADTRYYRISDAIGKEEVENLIYFGMSIFWRAAAHEWPLRERKVHIELGKYQEELRQYLLGAPFPKENVHLYVRISALEWHCRSIFEPLSKTTNGYHHHGFNVGGVVFTLAVGKKIPEKFEKRSTVPGGMVAISEVLDAIDAEDYRAMMLGVPSRIPNISGMTERQLKDLVEPFRKAAIKGSLTVRTDFDSIQPSDGDEA